MDPPAHSWGDFFGPWDAALGPLGQRSVKMVVRRGLPGTPRDGIIQRKAADPYVLVPLGGSLGKPEVVLRLRSLMDAKLVGQGRHPKASNIRQSDIGLYAEIFPILQHKIGSAFGMGIFTDTMGAFEYGASPRSLHPMRHRYIQYSLDSAAARRRHWPSELSG